MVNKRIVKEWLDQADEDFAFASANLDVRDEFYSRICFHFQQAAEKYLKAFIIFKGLELKKIHNLNILLNDSATVDKELEELKEECLFLNPFYIDTRYPAFWPVGRSRKEAEKAREAAKEIGNLVKKKIKKS